MEEKMVVLTEKKGPVFTITINRPEVRNAVDGPTAAGLGEAFRTFEADTEAKVGVLTGAEGCFCAGADLKAVSTDRDNLRFEESGEGPLGCSRMWLSKPMIAAVAGYAVAGGLELAVLCDLRVMEQDAIFGAFCRRWGVPFIDGCTVRLPRLIGMSNALDVILTGRPIGAEEALRMGLANKVVETGTSLAEAQKMAEQIASFPERCMLSDRRSVYEGMDMPFGLAMRNEFRLGIKTVESGETRAGATRFADGYGRHGSFKGFGKE